MRTEPPFAGERPEARSDRGPDAPRRSALTVIAPARGYPGPLSPSPEMPPSGLDIGMLLRTLKRRLPIIIAMVVLGTGLGVAAQSSITPRYSSSVAILLEPRRSDSFGADSQFGNSSIFVDGAKIASAIFVLESSELLGNLVKQLHLGDDPEFGDQQDSRLHKWFGFLPFVKAPPVVNDPEVREERALGRLRQAVRAERVGFAYVLTISVTATRPQMAQKLATAVSNAFLSDQVETKMAVTRRDGAWLAERVDEARAELLRSEEAVEAIRRKYGLTELDQGSGATPDQQTIAGLTTQLTQARADVTTTKARYDYAERLRASGGALESLPEVASSATIAGLRRSQTEAAEKLASLSANYQDSFPEVRHLKDHQVVVQREISDEIVRIIGTLRHEYESAVARERGFSQQLQQASVAESGSDTAEGQQQLRDAKRLVEANRGVYDSFLNRWHDVQQQQMREEPEGRIVAQANLPTVPNSPKPLILPAGGGALFLALGLGLTLVPPLLDTRFASVNDVERRLGLLVLGAIPMLRRRDLAFARRKGTIIDYTKRRPLSHFAESLRMLRAHMRISVDGVPSVVQITSAIAGEGKSTVASALAMSAASAGVRTALVDVDLRSSSLSGMFGLRHEEGVSEILELGIPFRSVARDLEDMPLTVIGAGSASLPRPDMINSAAFAAFVRELSETYSLVILDCPPVLPVSDALVISRYADATIVVVEWRATARTLAEQTVKVLRTVNAPLVGAILNKIDLSKVSQYEYGNQYQYGSQGPTKTGGRGRRA